MSKKSPLDSLHFKDDPSVQEVFADGLRQAMVDESGLRLTFTVNRPELPSGSGQKLGGYKTVAARIVMPTKGLAELYNELSQMVQALEARGLLKRDGGGMRATMQ